MKEPLKYFLERTTPFGALARFQRQRQLKKKFRQWGKNGAVAPMPNLGKQQVIIDYIKKFLADIFIETGTYKGRMVYAVQPHIKEIFSIELDQAHYKKAQQKFAGYPNIHILHGQSSQVLPKILEGINKPCLFWLDAHWSGSSTAKADIETPIMQELECILNHHKADEHIILIDDARCFTGENDYPTIEGLRSFILDKWPGWVFEVKDDIIRTHSNIGMSENNNSNTWLDKFAKNVTSQYGENGIIEKALEIMGDNNKWCVEFGSWDGKKCSNTYNLISEKGYSAVLIEGSSKRFKDLQKTFEENKDVILLNAFVGFEKENSLDVLLKPTPIPVNFDVFSIDIDGNDYHTWNAVKDYKPKIVVIEFNPTISPEVEFVQPADFKITQGSSLLSINKLAKSKGYELVAATTTNAIFVDSKYFALFGIEDNSVDTMMIDKSFITHLFCGYDGTVFIRGCGLLPWQQIKYKESRLQQLPKWARKVVGDRNIIRKKLGKHFRRLCKKNIL